MPTYEYACTNCGNEFERFESITAKPDKSCPQCKKKKAERRISAGGGFIFKGSGFYITDYKNKRTGSDSAKTETETAKPDAAKTDTAKKDAPATPAAATGGCGTGCGCHPAPAKPAGKSKKSA
jgi:putative FmdB family regulatory protein